MDPTNKLISQAEAHLPTQWGDFILSAYTDHTGDYCPHLALRHPDMNVDESVYVRIHSECITGDIFHSLKCDCGQQLDESMCIIAKKKGVLIYLRQEGRGIGIINKIKAYRHQEKGLNTIEANQVLGLKSDYREYRDAAAILKLMNIRKIHLITNNPEKMEDIQQHGIEVVERVPIVIAPNQLNIDYLRTKKKSMGHFLKPDL